MLLNYDLSQPQTAASSAQIAGGGGGGSAGVTDPSTAWNSAWNTGYNQANSSSNPYAGQVVGGYDLGAGFTQGQQQYLSDLANKNSGLKTTATPNATPVINNPSTPDFSSLVPSQEEINAQWQVNNDFINSNYNQMLAQYPQYEAQLKAQYDTSIANITNQRDQALNQTKLQQGYITQQQQSAISRARQMYNELNQQGISKFGAGSSAGPAYNAIIGKATSQAVSGADTTAINALDQIAQSQNQLNAQWQIGTQQIENWFNSGKSDLQSKLQADIAKINNDRRMNDLQKQTAQMDALREARTMYYNWESARQSYLDQLNLTLAANQTQLNNQQTAYLKSIISPEAINAQGQAIKNAGNAPLSAITGTSPQVASAYNPSALGSIQGFLDLSKQEDPYKSLNVFA